MTRTYTLLLPLCLFLRTLAWGQPVPDQEDEVAVAMLDGMQQLLTGGGQFNRTFLAKLGNCLDELDLNLRLADEGGWSGFVAYHDSNGTEDDRWGGCLDTGHCHKYHEQNMTRQEYHNIEIYEPCNYASNLAYYHDVTMICAHKEGWNIPREYVVAMAQGFTALTMGSSFWHGSHTLLGNIADNRFIDIVSYVAHQASLLNLPTTSSVLTDLSLTPRNRTSVQVTQQLMDMLQNDNVNTWQDGIADLDTPQYMLTFSGIICNVLTLLLSPETVDMIVPNLMDVFGIPDEDRTFILDHYLPEIRIATANVNLGILEETQFELNFVGTLTKLLYAFLWQEYVLTGADIFLDPEVNQLGALLMPAVNSLANWLTDFPVLDEDLQNAINIYPGDVRCNNVEPHSKWHVESANGLMDLMLLADDMFRLTE